MGHADATTSLQSMVNLSAHQLLWQHLVPLTESLTSCRQTLFNRIGSRWPVLTDD